MSPQFANVVALSLVAVPLALYLPATVCLNQIRYAHMAMHDFEPKVLTCPRS